jgi:hypothetical protein
MDTMTALLGKFLEWVLALLPTSPFTDVIDQLQALPYLGYLNWFVPIGTFIKIGSAWLGAITLFYMYSIILRWIRAIE